MHKALPIQRRGVLAAAASVFVFAACGKQAPEGAPASKSSPSSSSSPSAAPAASSEAPSIEAIAANAKGFSVGALMRAQTVYVFFDPQCPHCAAMWEDSKQLAAAAHFVWIPVRLLGDKSLAQGAAILGATDPAAAMEMNEQSVRAQQGGISAMDARPEMKDAVAKNTELFNRFGFNGVPTIVAKHAQSGSVVVVDGALPAATLAQRLGLQ